MLTGRKIVSKTTIDTDYIDLEFVKTWLRVSSDVEDTIISALISGAINQVSSYLGYSVVEANTKYAFDTLIGSDALIDPFLAIQIQQGNYLRIPSRVKEIVSVKYIDESNTQVDLPYVENEITDFVFTISINEATTSLAQSKTKYIVEVVEGFDVDNFPSEIKTAVCLLVAQYYDNRQAIIVGTTAQEMPLGVQYILDPFKIYSFS